MSTANTTTRPSTGLGSPGDELTQSYPDWHDPSWPWIAKLDRAKHHIDTLETEVAAFERSAYHVTCDPGEKPGDTVIRLHISEPIPVRFSTVLGDAIHNMRSALDTLAFELAHRHVGRELTEDEQKICSFPIYLHRKDLDGFFTDRRRRPLYGPAEREALLSIVPGHMWDGLDPADAASIIGPRENDVQHDTLWTLNRLWNIDMHRRLHFTVWWPDLIYWTSQLGDAHLWNPGHPPWVDGAVLGTITAIKTSWPVQAENITATVQLRMVEDWVNGNGIVDAMRQIHGNLCTWVFPHAFQIYDWALARQRNGEA